MKGTRLRYKLSALLLAAFLVFGLTACSGSDAEDRKMDNAKDTTQESTDNKSDNSEDSENSKKTKKKNNSSDDGSEDSTNKKGKKNKDADTDGNSGKDNTDKKTEKKAEKKNSDNSDKKAGKKNADKSDKSNSASKDSTGTGDTSELDIDNLFSDRDLNQTPDLSEAITIKVTDGATIDITESGTYLISGTAKNCTIRAAVAVDVDDPPVHTRRCGAECFWRESHTGHPAFPHRPCQEPAGQRSHRHPDLRHPRLRIPPSTSPASSRSMQASCPRLISPR